MAYYVVIQVGEDTLDGAHFNNTGSKKIGRIDKTAAEIADLNPVCTILGQSTASTGLTWGEVSDSTGRWLPDSTRMTRADDKSAANCL